MPPRKRAKVVETQISSTASKATLHRSAQMDLHHDPSAGHGRLPQSMCSAAWQCRKPWWLSLLINECWCCAAAQAEHLVADHVTPSLHLLDRCCPSTGQLRTGLQAMLLQVRGSGSASRLTMRSTSTRAHAKGRP